MGRSSATKRQQGIPGQHSTKHENGIVGPGKKVQKGGSHGQLNGSHKQSADKLPSTTTTTTPATPPYLQTPPLTDPSSRKDLNPDPRMTSDLLRRVSVEAYAESSSGESYQQAPPSVSIPSESHRRIDVNSAKNPAVHQDVGPLGLLSSVLRSCPLWDTIAILIILLQMPFTILTIIHMLFVALTFAPASTTGQTFNLVDIFEGALGTPSLGTTAAVDLVVLLVWLFLWRPLQDISLDFAQSVIAMTLGGGASGRDSGIQNVFVCLGVILVSHFASVDGINRTSLRMFLPELSAGLLGVEPDDVLETPPPQSHKGFWAWIRTILAIHILTQGMVRYVRDWIIRREKRDILSNSNGDPESLKASVNAHSENLSNESTTNQTLNGLVTEHEHSQTNGTDKTPNAKKKKKANALVRIRQPLWSALASTKIVMAKEYETQRANGESAGANATGKDNLGNAPFNVEPNRIWITYVGFDEVCFNTSFFPTHVCANTEETKQPLSDVPGVDNTKPFYVRVGKNPWALTRIIPNDEPASQSENETHWCGEIYGLAPSQLNGLEFVSTSDGSVLFSTSIRTLQAPTSSGDGIALPLLSPNVQQSPKTAIRTSIATQESKRDDERNRQKQQRKDLKTKLNAVRREIDKLSSTISSSGSNDDRLRQKTQQSNLHAKQADDAVALLTQQLTELCQIPETEALQYHNAKQSWQSQRDAHLLASTSFEALKKESETNISSLSAEVTAFQIKREGFQNRIKKQDDKLERITDANAKGLDEAQRKESERQAKEADRERSEVQFLERIESMTKEIEAAQSSYQEVYSNIQHMMHLQQLSMQAYNNQYAGYDVPEPHGNTNYQWNPAANYDPYRPTSNANGLVPASMSPHESQFGQRTRGRSSSMLSNVSGFTQSSTDEAPALPRETQDLIDRAKSEGSSSASGSVGDASPALGYRSGTIIGGSRYLNPWDDKS